MRLGYLTHVAGSAPAQAYRDTVTLAVAAEELGYSSFWVAQHHDGHLDGLLPSPLVLLAAVAQATSTIRLGTAVVVAALEDPRRLAEDAAVLDVLSGGRLELGVGAGADATASETFGRDHSLRHDECATAVDALRAHLAEIVPAAPGLGGRLWQATGTPDGVAAAGARGMGILTGRADAAPHLARYWARAAGEPRVAAVRVLGPGERPGALLERWRTDPAREWSTELLVQTQPAHAPVETHLATLRALVAPPRDPDRPAPVAPLVAALRSGPRRAPVPSGRAAT
ncbi:LLM class flavin-dependent oxidoreductase [Pseudonocardia abyssalis]|uniref:LLM class flavin-dependent oxidoreductase n=1 Tax=Pseudonocardia abyssalis TaxID=2792008 RepID=A0ABS6UV33_9PSEU|nr:LLM class flavin-dependent oxidoreductase [Pseudonocardia abyssalis]MBW0116908.1 LLM class flavin-dependent oxidoreductase [Pseudonocardia abyssalis]MBW0136095.1 LLM class flavin-dependent oxidoreductase [Pseudonocardia abyssalis]